VGPLAVVISFCHCVILFLASAGLEPAALRLFIACRPLKLSIIHILCGLFARLDVNELNLMFFVNHPRKYDS